MTLMIETSRTNCFVSPVYCKHLLDAGVSAEVPYQWHIYSDVAKLHTRLFDPLNFYRESDFAINEIYPPKTKLPAFSIKDVEKLLPQGFLLTVNHNSEYEISLPNIYEIESCISGRMPDAFAMLVLKSLKLRLLDVKKINSILSK